jgi:hypothetical protein
MPRSAMNERVQRLRTESLETPITISVERAELITDFYRENIGKYSTPMMRAKALEYLYRAPDDLHRR